MAYHRYSSSISKHGRLAAAVAGIGREPKPPRVGKTATVYVAGSGPITGAIRRVLADGRLFIEAHETGRLVTGPETAESISAHRAREDRASALARLDVDRADSPRRPHHSGAEAKHGDIVRNLTTGEVATVTDCLQSGRVAVKLPYGGGYGRWERVGIEVLASFEGVS